MATRTRSGTHAVIDNAATLVYLANQAVITTHVWLSRVDALDRPDHLIFDLDPPGRTSAWCGPRRGP